VTQSKHSGQGLAENIGGAIAIGACLVFSPLLRPWYGRWGATRQERIGPLPGDEAVPRPWLQATRAITVGAPAARVWQFLVQMGHGRGGLYSLERLENFARCDMHNAAGILPEFQALAAGDRIRLGPDGYPFFTVSQIDPERAIVLHSGPQPKPGEAVVSTWAMVVQPLGPASSRLLFRTRFNPQPGFGNWLMWRGITDPISFVMERKMLLGIKARAES
jgi:hypothetical protein